MAKKLVKMANKIKNNREKQERKKKSKWAANIVNKISICVKHEGIIWTMLTLKSEIVGTGCWPHESGNATELNLLIPETQM